MVDPGYPRLELARVEASEAAVVVATEIAALVREAHARGTSAVVGLATGRTMESVYRELARLHRADPLPASGLVGVLIDEYVGLARTDPRRFRAWIEERLAPLALPRERLISFEVDGTPFAVERGARRYAAWIVAQGGIDLLLLGVGRNGHIGFNEPGASPRSRARTVDLARATRADAARGFGSLESVPHRAVTLGIADLRAAKRVRVLAFGHGKREALRRLRTRTPSSDLPLSLLRGHADARLYADEAALGAPSAAAVEPVPEA